MIERIVVTVGLASVAYIVAALGFHLAGHSIAASNVLAACVALVTFVRVGTIV